ncbi:MAG: YfiR family protein [Deltaproteobacteria bacterium]|nr:YfiR family protein [Deltaproteobacteria bacterium]
MTDRQRQAALRLIIALVLLFGAVLPRPALGDHHMKEYEVKAAFLFNFTKFVTWSDTAPADAGKPFVIAVIGDDPFGEALSVLERKTAQGRTIVVRRVHNLDSLKNCRILFISSSVGERLPSILRTAHARNILTVGDTERFASRGGIIGLVLAGDRIGFEINTESAKHAGLTISSKLLSLAKAIHREGIK